MTGLVFGGALTVGPVMLAALLCLCDLVGAAASRIARAFRRYDLDIRPALARAVVISPGAGERVASHRHGLVGSAAVPLSGRSAAPTARRVTAEVPAPEPFTAPSSS